MRLLYPLAFSTLLASAGAAQEPARDVMVVFDMSGSMWGQVDGVAKVEIARDAFGDLITDWNSNNTRAGLIAYGHRRKGDCSDIELLAQPDADADIASLVATLKPRGKTPLSDAVQQAADVLKYTEEAATVVLLSDGVETCDADPCAVGAELEALGLDFTAHVIGFDIAEGDKAQLQCLATATGGQYFDAAGADGLSDAMKGVAQATAVEAPEEVRSQDFQTLTIRVKMATRALDLPDAFTIYGDDIALGTLSDATAVVPGLPIELPFGPIRFRVEGQGIFGETTVDITDQTEMIELEVTDAEAEYVIWREGQLPVLEGGKEHIILLKNTTGVDRNSFYRSWLYPGGSTDRALALKAGNISPYAGVYHSVRVPSPQMPGDYELVPTANDGTEYGRIPISFAATIDPVWQGPREVAPGEVFDAFWAGSSNRLDLFQFRQNGKAPARRYGQRMDKVATKDGFKLTAPDVPGVYDLVFRSSFENSLGSKETALGVIAVGVPLPQSDAPADKVGVSETAGADTNGLAREADAMGGEESPLLPVGDLHGDWKLVFRDNQRTIPLIKFQLSHAKGEPASTGGLVIEASPDWGFGPRGGFGDMTLAKRDNDGLLMTIEVAGDRTDFVMTPAEIGWSTDMSVEGANTYRVSLIKAKDLAAIETAQDKEPVDHSIIAFLEDGQRVDSAVEWTIKDVATGESDRFNSDTGHGWDEGRTPGTYLITARSGELTGKHTVTLGRGHRGGNVIIMRPEGEGDDLGLDADYYCSEGETCQMTIRDIPLDFTLPLGWGAERPIADRDRTPVFNMSTNTPDGPFFATLNQPQRSAALGPCVEIVNGTFCHDATDDPALLADIETLKRSLSFRATGVLLNKERYNDLLTKLTGAAE